MKGFVVSEAQQMEVHFTRISRQLYNVDMLKSVPQSQ